MSGSTFQDILKNFNSAINSFQVYINIYLRLYTTIFHNSE